MIALLALTAYISTIPLANWFISNIGTVCVPDGPCLIPVGFGLTAPSGVLLVGLSLFLRDVVQDQLGRGVVAAAILAGAIISLAVASPALALASGAAFLLSELADFAAYTPLRQSGRWSLAVLASGVVGSVVDSAVFLWLAFGSLNFLAGQVVGKVGITALCALAVFAWGNRRRVPAWRLA